MKSRKVNSVFLCRSPLQARICLEIIKYKRLKDFDVIYFSHEDNELDKNYYSLISNKANFSIYIKESKNNKDILNHLSAILRLKKQWPRTTYLNIYIASIDNYMFRYIIKKNQKATLFGFDDGAANISSFGHYYHLNKFKRAILYSKVFRLPQPEAVRRSLSKHFTIYHNFENIVPDSKLVTIRLFDFETTLAHDSKKSMTYFIGQPFHEYLKPKEIMLLKSWLDKQDIDYYIMHPREKKPLMSNIKLLKKNGLLAEDAIFKSSQGSNVKVISAYSTVLFNIHSKNAEKIYLSLNNDQTEKERCRLIKKTGSEIINIF